MALVRVRLPGGIEKNVGDVYAENLGLTVLADEPTHNTDGTVRSETRSGGRRSKPKTTVAKAAAEKKESGR